MEQQKLEEKVRDLFKRQGFELKETEHGFRAEKDDEELSLKAFSSEKYSANEIQDMIQKGDKVFVDGDLSDIQDRIENDVSVLEEEKEEKEFETPSYEVICDIAVINDLAGIDRNKAVEGILHHQNVDTILLKEGGLKGEFRVGDYEKLYGEETETVHTEFGCRYRVDPTKVYFSERFSTERKRVVDQINDDEKVLVMFAGVGPFAILAAKKANPEKVVAVEKNPEGAAYLKENIELNGVEETVEGIEGDVKEVVPELGSFDRIIMPLPESAREFLELALNHSEDNGVIHYYRFVEDKNYNKIIQEVEDSSANTERRVEILDYCVCGERGPGVERVCFDLKASSETQRSFFDHTVIKHI